MDFSSSYKYGCFPCKRKLHEANAFKSHFEKFHAPTKRVVCALCGEFMKISEFIIHADEKCKRNGKYKCLNETCHFRCSFREVYCKHIDLCYSRYICTCKKIFSLPLKFAIHVEACKHQSMNKYISLGTSQKKINDILVFCNTPEQNIFHKENISQSASDTSSVAYSRSKTAISNESSKYIKCATTSKVSSKHKVSSKSATISKEELSKRYISASTISKEELSKRYISASTINNESRNDRTGTIASRNEKNIVNLDTIVTSKTQSVANRIICQEINSIDNDKRQNSSISKEELCNRYVSSITINKESHNDRTGTVAPGNETNIVNLDTIAAAKTQAVANRNAYQEMKSSIADERQNTSISKKELCHRHISPITINKESHNDRTGSITQGNETNIGHLNAIAARNALSVANRNVCQEIISIDNDKRQNSTISNEELCNRSVSTTTINKESHNDRIGIITSGNETSTTHLDAIANDNALTVADINIYQKRNCSEENRRQINPIWICNLCTTEFTSIKSLITHLRSFHNVTNIKCCNFQNSESINVQNNESQCNLFKDEAAVLHMFCKLKRKHEQVINKSLYIVKCVFCDRTFRNDFTCVKHLLEEINCVSYSCKQCRVELTSSKECIHHAKKYNHQVNDLPSPNYIAWNWACNFIQNQINNTKKFNSIELLEDGYKCPFDDCSYNFNDGFNLQGHMFEHCGYRPWICGFCNERFTDFRFLFDHIKEGHNKSELCVLRESIYYIESYVENKIMDSFQLNSISMKDILYPCNQEGCNYQADAISEYALHITNHIVNLHHCPFCSVEGSDSALSKHCFDSHNDIFKLSSEHKLYKISYENFPNYINILKHKVKQSEASSSNSESDIDFILKSSDISDLEKDNLDCNDYINLHKLLEKEKNSEESEKQNLNYPSDKHHLSTSIQDRSSKSKSKSNNNESIHDRVPSSTLSPNFPATTTIDLSNYMNSTNENLQRYEKNDISKANDKLSEKNLQVLSTHITNLKSKNLDDRPSVSKCNSENNELSERLDCNENCLKMIPLYICNHCNYDASILDEIQEHVKFSHFTSEFPYKQRWQSSSTSYQSNITNDVRLKCSHCSFRGLKLTFIEHLVYNHPFLYICGNCNGIFSAISKIIEHNVRLHINENLKIFLLYDEQALSKDSGLSFKENGNLPTISRAVCMMDITELRYRKLRNSDFFKEQSIINSDTRHKSSLIKRQVRIDEDGYNFSAKKSKIM